MPVFTAFIVYGEYCGGNVSGLVTTNSVEEFLMTDFAALSTESVPVKYTEILVEKFCPVIVVVEF